MAEVTIDNILGDIVPSVYIKNITLESSGQVLEESNPHIDDEREPNIIRNEQTGKLEREEISFSTVNKNLKSEYIKSTITLSIKEILGDGLISTWFSNQDFMKYFYIGIVQVSDEEISNDIVFKKHSIESFLFDDKQFKTRERNRAKYESKIIFLKELLRDKKITDYDSFIDSDGNKVYNIDFTTTFLFRSGNPKFLSYHVVSFLNLQQLAQDYHLDTGTRVAKSIPGEVRTEIVIDEYETVSENYIFLTPDGQLWTKDIHQTDDGVWRSGVEEQPESQNLTIQVVPNTKVQDFRDIKEIEKYSLDLVVDSYDDMFDSSKIVVKNNTSLQQVLNKKPYFGELYSSRDPKGNIRFFFSIDMIQVAKQNSILGGMFRTGNESLLNYIVIRSMKIMRYRINERKQKISDNDVVLFDYLDEIPKMVAISGEHAAKSFGKYDSQSGVLREVVLRMEDSERIRTFTGIDRTVSKLTFGKYVYGVEIDFIDNTPLFVQDVLQKLKESKMILEMYYNESLSKNNFDRTSNKFKSEFINQQIQKYSDDREDVAPWIYPISIYLGTLSTLVKNFRKEKFNQNLFSAIHPKSATPDTILSVVTIIDNFTRKVESLTYGTGYVGTVGKRQTEKTFKSSLHSSKSPIRIFKLEKKFNTIIDSEIQKNVGYDFLGRGELEEEKSNEGLKVVTGFDFEERVKLETEKYYQSATMDISLISETKKYTINDSLNKNKYSFLTPASVSLGKLNTISLLGNHNILQNSNLNTKVVGSIAAYKSLRNSPQVPLSMNKFRVDEKSSLSSEEQFLNANLMTMLNNNNFSVETLSKNKDDQVKVDVSKVLNNSAVNNDRKEVENIAEKESLSSNPNNILLAMADKLIVDKKITRNKSENELQKQFNSIFKFDLKNKDNLIDKLNLSSERIMNLPNQIKSLMVDSVSQNKVRRSFLKDEKDSIRDVRTRSIFRMNYDILKQVEVLMGFGMLTRGEMSTKVPRWEILTPEIFNRAKSKVLLCRVRDYEDKQLGIKFPKLLELPIYNEYFFLSPEKAIPSHDVNFGVSNVQRIMASTRIMAAQQKKSFFVEFTNSTVKKMLNGSFSKKTIIPIKVVPSVNLTSTTLSLFERLSNTGVKK